MSDVVANDLHQVEIVHDHEDDDDDGAKVVAWAPPPPSSTPNGTTRQNAILALQAAAVAAQEFNAHFDVRDEERESSIPLFAGSELVLGKAPLRPWGRFFDEFELKAVKLLPPDQDEEQDHDETDSGHGQAREKLVSQSIDGHYSVKLLRSGIIDNEIGVQAAEDFMLETRLLMNLAPHPNLVQLYGLNRAGIDTLLEPGRDGFFIITDRIHDTLMDRLANWRAKKGYRPPSVAGQTIKRFAQRIEIAIDIASALKYLHERNLVYHVRPDKIGFDVKKGVIKLHEFGQVRQEGSAQAQARSLVQCGDMDTLRYTAPEVLCQAPATTSSDVYSFGIVLWEIMSLKSPFGNLDRSSHWERCVQSHNRPPMNRQWPTLGQDILQNTWHPHVRWTMRKVHSKLTDLLMMEEANSHASAATTHAHSANSSQRSRQVESNHRRFREESSGHTRNKDETSLSQRKSRTVLPSGTKEETSGHRRQRGEDSSSQRKSRSTVTPTGVATTTPQTIKEKLPPPQEKDEDEPQSESSARTSPLTDSARSSSGESIDSDKRKDKSTAEKNTTPVVEYQNDNADTKEGKKDAAKTHMVSADDTASVVKDETKSPRKNTLRHASSRMLRDSSSHIPPEAVQLHHPSRRRSSLACSTAVDPNGSVVQPIASPQRSRQMHRSASMSNVPAGSGAFVPQTPLELAQSKKDDYEDDYEQAEGDEEDKKSKGFYGYMSKLVKAKKSGNKNDGDEHEDDDDSSVSSSNSVSQSPLRRRLGGVATVLLGGSLRRPSLSESAADTPGSPIRRTSSVEAQRTEPVTPERSRSSGDKGSRPNSDAGSASKKVPVPLRAPSGCLEEMVASQHESEDSARQKKGSDLKTSRHDVTRSVRKSGKNKDGRSRKPDDTESTNTISWRRQKPVHGSGHSHSKTQGSNATTNRDPASEVLSHSEHSPKSKKPNLSKGDDPDTGSTISWSRQKTVSRSDHSNLMTNRSTPATNNDVDQAETISWRRQKSVRGLLQSSPRRASLGRIKSSRFIASSRNVPAEQSSEDAATKEKQSSEKQCDENEKTKEDSTTAKANRRPDDNSLRRRRAFAGASSRNLLPGGGQESTGELPECPSTPAKPSRQRRRVSTGAIATSEDHLPATPGLKEDVPQRQTTEPTPVPATPSRVRQRRRSTGGNLPLMGGLGDETGTRPQNHRQASQRLTSIPSSRKLGLEHYSSTHHTRMSADDPWTNDLAKPLQGSPPELSSGTANMSSSIDSSHVDRLVGLEGEKEPIEEDQAPMEPVTPRRRLARLSSVTQLFRKGGNTEGNEPPSANPSEMAPTPLTPGGKLRARFMKVDGKAK